VRFCINTAPAMLREMIVEAISAMAYGWSTESTVRQNPSGF